MENSEKAILQALIYSDLFAAPLSIIDIWRYLPAIRIPFVSYKKSLDLLEKHNKIYQEQNWYVLSNKQHLLVERRERSQHAKKKFRIANKVAHILRFVPSILLVGISGSLAMDNTRPDDDIDIFIVTKRYTLWITRLLVLFMLMIINKRRRHNSSYVADMICPNMFIDETSLTFSSHDLYTAHEIIQLKPLVDKNNTYSKFLYANQWVKDILPQGFNHVGYKKRQSYNITYLDEILGYILIGMEPIARLVQVLYMKKHKTTELTTNTMLAFHPYNYKIVVLKKYAKLCKQYNV